MLFLGTFSVSYTLTNNLDYTIISTIIITERTFSMNFKKRFTPPNEFSKLNVCLLVTTILSLAAFGFIFHRENYVYKISRSFGYDIGSPQTNWTLLSWKTSLKNLEINSDIVFFGDSITRGSNFHKKFTNKKIVNL